MSQATNTIVPLVQKAQEKQKQKQSKAALILLCKERGITGYSSKSVDELQGLLTAETTHNKSPLRYPGGKTRAVKILEKILLENAINIGDLNTKNFLRRQLFIILN